MKKIFKGKSIFLAVFVIITGQGIDSFAGIPVYRLYNTVSKVHLYSTDANEKAVLGADPDWNYEKVVWNGYRSDTGQHPVYRLYSPGLGKHLFTMDENEKNVLDAGPVWQFEKIAWYANSTPYSGDIPIYRLYSDGLKQHLYTADVNEKNTLDGNGVWVYEGIAYYTLAASTSEPTPTPVSKMQLTAVRNWAYNIQHVDTSRQREELVGTHFDMYVLELAVTETGKENFDIAALIRDIRQYNISTRNVDPLILAYVDVGQAEEWRWYFGAGWGIGNPEWIAGNDPDNWAGNFPVAYWYPDWQNIVIYGYNGRSMVEETLKAGFDGIYMDWVEAFSDVNVTAKAQADGIDPAAAMFDFIGNIRTYARQSSPNANPGYLVIAQNASDLYQENPGRYNSVIDAIALEAIWYDGDGGFDNWDDPSGYNVLTNAINPGWTEEVLSHLQPMKAYMPIFCVEYAQDMNGLLLASDIYNTKAPAEGFIPYCSRRSLSRLSTTPYPSGYSPIDY